jgi:hypothetical protein
MNERSENASEGLEIRTKQENNIFFQLSTIRRIHCWLFNVYFGGDRIRFDSLIYPRVIDNKTNRRKKQGERMKQNRCPILLYKKNLRYWFTMMYPSTKKEYKIQLHRYTSMHKNHAQNYSIHSYVQIKIFFTSVITRLFDTSTNY